MLNKFIADSTAQELKANELMCPIPIVVNDRAATREAIIRLIRKQNVDFIERSSWGAYKTKGTMIDDWDYSMIALHHAGRSFGCGTGEKQMREVQSNHQAKFDDLGYHYGIDCLGRIFEGRDIRFKGSNVNKYNTGVIGVVLLENLTTSEEGQDMIAFARQSIETFAGKSDQAIPPQQIDALLSLIHALASVFMVKNLGGHQEFSMQAGEGKICPGNIGMELVRNLRVKTQLLPPPAK
ncbi:peptidoglycan recognition protein family protein [Pseudomonas chlororaphis]|uniref:peptidoglycan recognition protein family protein n=1 Tax=Pseudomonas chlororaphis TaxID=587753 RepID=UPI00209A8ABB|nr:peptidoglycan recognition family protein [Pseudomonas chlororaphis]MCO7610764.1 peptidoglycan recognition protein family protein [Pseudomonas chlororaphis]